MLFARLPAGRIIVGAQIESKITARKLGASQKLGMLVLASKAKLFLSVHVDDMQDDGSKRKLSSGVGKLAKEDPALSSNTTNRSNVIGMRPKISKSTENRSEQKTELSRRFTTSNAEKLTEQKYNTQKVSTWSSDMKGHAEQCMERYCDLTKKPVSQLEQSGIPCIDDHQMKKD